MLSDRFDEVIAKAREINDRPVVIDFIVGKDAQVWPMVAAGTGNDQIMAARDIRPLFDDTDSVADDAADVHEVTERIDAAVLAAQEEDQ